MIICDIDGTVAHRTTRGVYDFDKADTDEVDPVIFELIGIMAFTHDIVWITGRPESNRQLTEQWLKDNGLPPGKLYMRADDDYSDAPTYKYNVWVDRLGETTDIMFVLEDREDIAKMWRALGIRCFQVAADPRFPTPRLDHLKMIARSTLRAPTTTR